MLEKIFKLKNFNTDFKSEILAGITTFITMAYIIFVNPQMMAASGMDIGASFVGTCIAASIACIAMGFFSNWPVGAVWVFWVMLFNHSNANILFSPNWFIPLITAHINSMIYLRERTLISQPFSPLEVL